MTLSQPVSLPIIKKAANYSLQRSADFAGAKETEGAQMTRDEARGFFISRLVAQAEREGVALSANERKMLDWSEVEMGCVADPEVAEGLAAEMSDQAYEAKMSRLLDAGYATDLAADPAAKDAYREAYSVLKQGDYYLLIMVEQALGRRLRRWWQISL
jgi:hypothetical protein